MEDGYPKFTREELLAHCVRIVRQSYKDDIEPSLREVYYDLVGEGLLKADAKIGEGTKADQRRNYRRIIDVIARAKESGDFPLEWLRDALRVPKSGDITTCDLNVSDGLTAAARWLKALPDWAITVDRWYEQPTVVLVVIEKDTLEGRCRRPVQDHGVPFFVCRGYPSWTGVYAWFQQLVALHAEFEDWEDYPDVVVLYMGDHDPSGMSIPEAMQGIVRSMEEVTGDEIPPVRWERVAITRDQALASGAPSMGVKRSDSRAPGYIAKYGTDAWEAEAMPAVEARDLLDRTIASYFDDDIFDDMQAQVAEGRADMLERMKADGWAASVLEGDDDE